MELLNRIMGKPANEDETEVFAAQIEALIERVVTALEGLDGETREQIVAQLRSE